MIMAGVPHITAGHDEDVAEADAWRARHAVFDQVGAFGHPRHALARFGEATAGLIISLQYRHRLGVEYHVYPKRLGNRIDGDVVMRRSDATGGEEVIVARPERVHRLDDRICPVWHDAHLSQADALRVQP
jgi:hypothetical protein